MIVQLAYIVSNRSRGDHSFDAGSAGRSDGQMFEGKGNVCDEGLSKECHDRDALES